MSSFICESRGASSLSDCRRKATWKVTYVRKTLQKQSSEIYLLCTGDLGKFIINWFSGGLTPISSDLVMEIKCEPLLEDEEEPQDATPPRARAS